MNRWCWRVEFTDDVCKSLEVDGGSSVLILLLQYETVLAEGMGIGVVAEVQDIE